MFTSSSLTKEGVLNDMLGYITQDMREKGQLAPSEGVTRPLPRVSSAEDLSAAIDTYTFNRQRQNPLQGGSVEPVTVDPKDSYAYRRRAFLEAHEGYREGVYMDQRGNPTVGIGFNMNREGARVDWAKANIRATFDDVRAGKARLTRPEVERLFDITISEAERHVAKTIGDVPLTQNQRIGLVSMAFNGPALIGPKITNAIRSGNWADVEQEVLYNSGVNKMDKGGWVNAEDASRRFVEAAAKEGLNVTVTSKVRSHARQWQLWNEGRPDPTHPGRRIGPSGMPIARPGTSRHERDEAFDISLEGLSKAQIARLGAIGESLGYEWGGRWGGSQYDPIHFQAGKSRATPGKQQGIGVASRRYAEALMLLHSTNHWSSRVTPDAYMRSV